MRRQRLSALVGMGVALALAAGCAETPPSSFYLLSADPPQPVNDGTIAQTGKSLAVGPVEIAAYLDRPQMVARSTDNRVDLAEFDRWAEPLDRMLPRVLSEDLSARLGNWSVVEDPRRRLHEADLRVTIIVTRFDVTPDGLATLNAQWQVQAGPDREIDDLRQTRLTEQVQSTDYAAWAAALSRLLGDFSSEIASVVSARGAAGS